MSLRPRFPHRRVVFAVLMPLLALVGCDLTSAKGNIEGFSLPVLDPRFADEQLTWAQGDVIHYGDQTLRLDAGAIMSLHPSPVGFFVEIASAPDLEGHWALFEGTETYPLPSDISSLAVSDDGRYVGWVDFDGPKRPAGQVAEAVVLDLMTGKVVGRTSDGMGGQDGDDLGDRYEELPPIFLGFDRHYAYYRDASGAGTTRRWDLASGEVGTINDTDAMVEKTPWQGEVEELNGFVTADGRYALDTSRTGRVKVFTIEGDKRTQLPLDFGHRWQTYGYMPSPHQLVVLTMDSLK
ncbi:MAG TPA: hypothetical protein PKE34_06515, partial [Marmoricola sp.]|nr:hypothetical protein [Marmoricola sp.]